jgi:hypothetical protein
MMQNKNKKRILNILILGLLFINACDDTESTQDKIYAIEGNVLFHFSEVNLDSTQKPVILLSLESVKIYGDGGMHMIGQLERVNNNFSLILYGIRKEMGLGDFSPAWWNSSLALGNGQYSLSISYQDNHSTFNFFVSDTSIIIQDTATSFMIPKYLTYWRYPQNSFMCTFSSDTSHFWLFEDFLDTLQKKVQLHEHHFPEYGVICYLPCCGYPGYDPPPRFFKYQTETDYYRCGEILNEYALEVLFQYPDVSIWLRDWKGREYFHY